MPLLYESTRMSTRPKKIDEDLKARAVRLVNDHLAEYPSVTAASAAVAKQVGVGKESVSRWVVQGQVDDGQRQGVTAEELAEIKKLRAETSGCVRTSRFSVRQQLSSSGSSTPATADHGFHRHHESRGPRGRVDLPGAARAGLPVAASAWRATGASSFLVRRPASDANELSMGRARLCSRSKTRRTGFGSGDSTWRTRT
jgi:transposase